MSIRSLTHRPITLLARTTTRSFWAIGLSLMFLAPAPVPITPEMQARYERKMDVVSDYLGDVVRTNREAHVLETELRSALGWSGGWLNGYDREEVAKIRAKLKPLRAEKRRVESKHFELEADAKSELGIWSEAGVSEAKDLFWNTARRGKQAATRGVLWDLFFEMFRADNYEDQINFLLRIVWIIVSNVFIFVFVSTITFLLEAIRLIRSFGPSFVSGLAFWCAAALAVISTMATILAATAGAGVGATYAVIRSAQRIEGAPGRGHQRRVRMGGRYGSRNAGLARLVNNVVTRASSRPHNE